MKKLLTSAAFVAMAMVSGSAFAAPGDADGSLSLTATSPESCSGLVVPSPKDFTGAFDANYHAVNVVLPQFSLGTVVCSFSGAKVGIKSVNGGLTFGNVPSGPGVQTVHYKAKADWTAGGLGGPTTTADLDTLLNGTTGQNSDATTAATYSSDLKLDLETQADTSQTFASGGYQDTLQINVGTGF